MESIFNNLRRHIAETQKRELVEHKMIVYIEDHIDKLHQAISINTVEPVASLFEFVSAYIESAYDYLDAIHTLSVESETSAYVQPFINLAFMFFNLPPELLLKFTGAQRLLYQAYLSNRLLEELNDQITRISDKPLSPMDIGIDNIVCHALIGDKLANQLDHLVFLAVETTEADPFVFQQPRTQRYLECIARNNWQSIRQRWPCFNNNLSVHFHISGL
jgi:hypothetical protein